MLDLCIFQRKFHEFSFGPQIGIMVYLWTTNIQTKNLILLKKKYYTTDFHV